LPRPRRTAAIILAATALIAAGCGDDDDSGSDREAAEAAATVGPQEAIAEIAAVRTGLAEGLAAYRSGDAEGADALVGDAYLEHFELVEVPLDRRNHELNEELEEQIRETLRGEIQDGAPVPQVAALIAEINRGLSEAEQALGRA
jgi:hypothetical protein